MDRRIAALSIVAQADPEEIIDGIADRQLDVRLLGILGKVSDPRAIDILCGYVSHNDWLFRTSAVQALGQREELARVPCIEMALLDENLVVRAEAIEAVSRWDPERAIVMYEMFLTAPGITPLLRERAEAMIRVLEIGRE